VARVVTEVRAAELLDLVNASTLPARPAARHSTPRGSQTSLPSWWKSSLTSTAWWKSASGEMTPVTPPALPRPMGPLVCSNPLGNPGKTPALPR